MSASAASLDVEALRGRFPALQGGTALLDGPGGSQVPQEVVDAMAGYLRSSNANLGGAFASSIASDVVVDEARSAAADLLGCGVEEVAFGQNMTTLNFLLAHAVCRTLEPGDEIVVTTLDHDANVSPWLLCAADRGLVVREVGVRAGDLAIDLDALRAVLGARTRVVAFTLASNAVGTIPDAHAIVAAAHAVGALAWADAVHYAPHRRIDVRALGVDVLLCSPYKYFGPHLGLAYGRYDLFAAWPADRVRPADQTPVGHRFETGTLSHEALAGFVAAVDYLASLGEGADRAERLDDAYARIGVYEDALCSHMLRELALIDGLRVYGIAEPARSAERTPTFCFTIAGTDPRSVAVELGEQGIAVWDGDYYALGIMRHLGLHEQGGAVRVGLLHYTTEGEVERVLAALRAIARRVATATASR